MNRLSQAHLVAEEAASGFRREEHSLPLIGIQRDLQQLLERRAGRPLRKQLLDPPAPAGIVPDLGDEREGVLVAAQFVSVRSGVLEEGVEAVVSRRLEEAIRTEIAGCEMANRRRAEATGAESDLALRAVAEEDFGVVGLEACSQGAPTTPPPFQRRQRELDVLACAQGVDGEVGARAVVVARVPAPDRD
ncbi:MAG: hypothetical protein WCI75_11785, partial [candidate division NC10 bacterium]